MPGALSAFKGQWPFQAQHHLAMPVFSAKMTRHHHRMCRILLYSSSSWEPCAPWPLQDGQLGFIHTILSLLQSGSCDKGHWSSAPAQTSSLASGVHGAELTDTSQENLGHTVPWFKQRVPPICAGNQQALGSAGKGFRPDFAKIQNAAHTWNSTFICILGYLYCCFCRDSCLLFLS